MKSPTQLRQEALKIWQAAVAAVDSQRLVHQALRREGSTLHVGEDSFDLNQVGRLVVVGAGKAGAGMAAAVEEVLGEEWMVRKNVTGWVNVPADCVRPLSRIQLHAARAAGQNEPTEDGVAGTDKILELVESLGEADLCLCLISGGGSALLPAPVTGITLADKQQVTRHLSGAGANIAELNTVRKQLSRIKGGGLLRSCRAGHLVTLVISDVLGDPLEIIASGPTVPDNSTPADAIAVLEQYESREAGISLNVFAVLQHKLEDARPITTKWQNLVIGNLAVAVDAGGIQAEQLGYRHAMDVARKLEGSAEDVGQHLARMARLMRSQEGPDCLITGGEPVVQLAAADIRGKGGRNQQLVLAALEELAPSGLDGIVLLSGGTDGEDGPTDAAGAFIDAEVLASAQAQGLDIADFLCRNDAYSFFASTGSLIKTGPTHTNVCDVRVVVVDQARD